MKFEFRKGVTITIEPLAHCESCTYQLTRKVGECSGHLHESKVVANEQLHEECFHLKRENKELLKKIKELEGELSVSLNENIRLISENTKLRDQVKRGMKAPLLSSKLLD